MRCPQCRGKGKHKPGCDRGFSRMAATYEIKKKEPVPCPDCEDSKMLGRIQEYEPATGRWHWSACKACNGTGYKLTPATVRE